MTSSLVVSNLSPRIKSSDLRVIFGEYGPLYNIEMKGIRAIITYENLEHAKEAKDDLNGRTLDGYPFSISFNYAKPNKIVVFGVKARDIESTFGQYGKFIEIQNVSSIRYILTFADDEIVDKIINDFQDNDEISVRLPSFLDKLSISHYTLIDDKIIRWLQKHENYTEERTRKVGIFNVKESEIIPFTLSDYIFLISRVSMPGYNIIITFRMDVFEISNNQRYNNFLLKYAEEKSQIEVGKFANNYSIEETIINNEIANKINNHFGKSQQFDINRENYNKIKKISDSADNVTNIFGDDFKLENNEVFNVLPSKLNNSGQITNISLNFHSTISIEEFGMILIHNRKNIKKIYNILSKALILHSYVAHIFEITPHYFYTDKASIKILMKIELISNEDYEITIGYLKTRLNALCSSERYAEEELDAIAETLKVDIKAVVSRKEKCKILQENINTLRYQDFEK